MKPYKLEMVSIPYDTISPYKSFVDALATSQSPLNARIQKSLDDPKQADSVMRYIAAYSKTRLSLSVHNFEIRYLPHQSSHIARWAIKVSNTTITQASALFGLQYAPMKDIVDAITDTYIPHDALSFGVSMLILDQKEAKMLVDRLLYKETLRIPDNLTIHQVNAAAKLAKIPTASLCRAAEVSRVIWYKWTNGQIPQNNRLRYNTALQRAVAKHPDMIRYL